MSDSVLNVIVLSAGLLSCFVVIAIYKFLKNIELEKKKDKVIMNFDTYERIIKSRADLAYNRIYKSEILGFSVNGYGLDEENLLNVCRSFIELTLKYLGPKLTKDYQLAFGDDVLYFSLVEEFMKRYEDDGVRNLTLETLPEGVVTASSPSTEFSSQLT